MKKSIFQYTSHFISYLSGTLISLEAKKRALTGTCGSNLSAQMLFISIRYEYLRVRSYRRGHLINEPHSGSHVELSELQQPELILESH